MTNGQNYVMIIKLSLSATRQISTSIRIVVTSMLKLQNCQQLYQIYLYHNIPV